MIVPTGIERELKITTQQWLSFTECTMSFLIIEDVGYFVVPVPEALEEVCWPSRVCRVVLAESR